MNWHIARRCFLIASTALGVSSSAQAATWSLGTAAESATPGVSLQRTQDWYNAVHVVSHFLESDRFTLKVDYQRFLLPRMKAFSGRGYRTGLYTGLGAKAETRKAEKNREHYSLRAPLGLQTNMYLMSLQIFTDIAAEFGPLPTSSARPVGRIGLRAAF